VLRYLTPLIFILASGLFAVASAEPMALPPQPEVRPAGMPPGYAMVSPCVAGMGEHWANLSNLNEPIYGTWQGSPIFTEIMVPLTALQNGVSFDDLRALPGYHIDHVDLEFEPRGHAGMMVPHYDLHAYYISAALQQRICPDGIPNSALKPASQP